MPLDALLIELEGIVLDTRRARLAERAAFDAAIRSASPAVDETDVELATLRAERAFDDALARLTVLVPGARDALAGLAVRLRIGVVTRLPRRVAERVLAAAELEPVVFTIVAAEDGAADLTAPGAYERALARLARLTPARTRAADGVVALVDAGGAIEGARRAGLRVVHVGDDVARGSRADARVASIAGVTYDALVHLLERSGVRPT